MKKQIEISNRICCIFNYPSHYRRAIYRLMDQNLNTDFYFGDKLGFSLEAMDVSLLQGYKKTLRRVNLGKRLYYLSGSVRLAFKNYQKYLLTGEPYCLSAWILLLLNGLQRKKTYLWTHGYFGDEGFLKKVIKKLYFDLAEGVFLYGNYARDIMIREGFKPAKLHVIYNSLSYDEQVAIRKTIKPGKVFKVFFKKELPTILFIGRIGPAKKPDLLIKALAELKKSGLELNLFAIGHVVSRQNLDALAQKLEIRENVCFYGACHDEKIISGLIFNADVCVSPGNVGLNAIHSLTYGTPVVTHANFSNQNPEFEAVRPGVTGDFFEEDSVDDLCQKIRRWILLDPARRARVREDAYRTIDSFYTPSYQMKVLSAALGDSRTVRQ